MTHRLAFIQLVALGLNALMLAVWVMELPVGDFFAVTSNLVVPITLLLAGVVSLVPFVDTIVRSNLSFSAVLIFVDFEDANAGGINR